MKMTFENQLADINVKISAEEAKLERTLKKSDVESYIIEALNSDAKTLVALLVDKVTLYEDTIEISFKYSNNTNPDETLTEVHRDFLLYGTKMKIRTGHTVLANQAQGVKEKSNSISPCPNLVIVVITQRSFTAIFELIK